MSSPTAQADNGPPRQAIIVAIDGYAGTGKSTTARLLAERLQYRFIDTGAMYRAVAFWLLQNHVDIKDSEAVAAALSNIQLDFERNAETGENELLLNGQAVGNAIRRPAVSAVVSQVSAIKPVRDQLVEQQRRIGETGAVVMDGRDIGTVVFPQAELKIFMLADMKTRVKRRLQELTQRSGMRVTEEEVEADLKRRDHLDSTREESPIRQAEDAYVLDTTGMQIPEQVEQAYQWAQQVMQGQ